MKIIAATTNMNKVREIREILDEILSASDDGKNIGIPDDNCDNGTACDKCNADILLNKIEVISMAEAGIDADIPETGTTFEENAEEKARAVMRLLTGTRSKSNLTSKTEVSSAKDEKIIVIADDSGLEIDALGGAPGIHSARFMGHDTPYDIKCAAILDKMKNVPDEKRTARFICAMAVAWAGDIKIFRGLMEGRIAREPAGRNGFGYDPIFYLPEFGCTSAELSPDEKNSVSHRGKALRAALQYIDSLRSN